MDTLFDYSTDTPAPDYQDHLRNALAAQYQKDLATLRASGIWPPPWQNEDFTIQQDEARLLSAIADNFGLKWGDAMTAVCIETANMIDMPTVGHARAVIVRCIELDYITSSFDRANHCIRLDLTNLGREMLDFWEEDQNENN